MTHWTLHWLEATGDLGPWRTSVTAQVDAARHTVAGLVPPPRLDILVQRLTGRVIPEVGIVGHAYRPGLFALTVDPDNPQFEASLVDGTLQRQVVHEVHHCLRMAGPGYGRTLGEALVSEGLAGQFTRCLFGNLPEPWEQAVDNETLIEHRPSLGELETDKYDHAEWFFGAGRQRPRWLGYTLGYRMVGEWLADRQDVDSDTWVNVPATEVLAAARMMLTSARRS